MNRFLMMFLVFGITAASVTGCSKKEQPAENIPQAVQAQQPFRPAQDVTARVAEETESIAMSAQEEADKLEQNARQKVSELGSNLQNQFADMPQSPDTLPVMDDLATDTNEAADELDEIDLPEAADTALDTAAEQADQIPSPDAAEIPEVAETVEFVDEMTNGVNTAAQADQIPSPDVPAIPEGEETAGFADEAAEEASQTVTPDSSETASVTV